MGTKLSARGGDGRVVIADATADIENYLSNLDKIYFHSSLNYLSVVTVMSGWLSLPARNANGSDVSSAYGSTIYTIGQHNLGYTPVLFGIATDTGQPLVGDTIIQAGGTASLRTIALGSDTTYVYAREVFLNKDVTFSAVSLQYRIFVFANQAV